MTDLIATLGSIPFAIAVTALLRKRWPAIDGAYVAVVVLACTVAAGLLSYYRASIPTEVWLGLGPIVAAVMSLGGVQAAQSVASKSTTRVIEWHQAERFPAEAPTKKD